MMENVQLDSGRLFCASAFGNLTNESIIKSLGIKTAVHDCTLFQCYALFFGSVVFVLATTLTIGLWFVIARTCLNKQLGRNGGAASQLHNAAELPPPPSNVSPPLSNNTSQSQPSNVITTQLSNISAPQLQSNKVMGNQFQSKPQLQRPNMSTIFPPVPKNMSQLQWSHIPNKSTQTVSAKTHDTTLDVWLEARTKFTESAPFKSWNSEVDKGFLINLNNNDPRCEIFMQFRDIFLAFYRENYDFFLSTDANFLGQVYNFILAGQLADALMLPVPGINTRSSYPLAYAALRFRSQCLRDPSISCDQCVYALLRVSGRDSRQYFFENCHFIQLGEKHNIKEAIIDNFDPEETKKSVNRHSFINFLMTIDADECVWLLLAKDSSGKTIFGHMKELQDANLIEKYNRLVDTKGLAVDYRIIMAPDKR